MPIPEILCCGTLFPGAADARLPPNGVRSTDCPAPSAPAPRALKAPTLRTWSSRPEGHTVPGEVGRTLRPSAPGKLGECKSTCVPAEPVSFASMSSAPFQNSVHGGPLSAPLGATPLSCLPVCCTSGSVLGWTPGPQELPGGLNLWAQEYFQAMHGDDNSCCPRVTAPHTCSRERTTFESHPVPPPPV